MGQKLAIDFGTTNSVFARWIADTETVEIITIEGLSDDVVADDLPPSVPSLVYINDGKQQLVTVGAPVRTQGFDVKQDNRLFRNFKRGIVASPAPAPRLIDDSEWADKDAGRYFVKHLINAMPFQDQDIEQLVLTAPVASFEGYLAWLNGVIDEISMDKIRVVDESTAAALGYAVTKPGAVVLVFDFGGGTLDLSLVQLPENRNTTGGLIKRLVGSGKANQHTAKVIAKAGRIIGGSDVDQWVLAEVLKRTHLTPQSLGAEYASVLTQCEKAKIALSTQEFAMIEFSVDGKGYDVKITRPELETLLEENGFFTALRRVIDKVMHVAHQRGIFKEDIHYVLLVGGTSLMPSVRHALGQYFTDLAVRADKPFTAVAEGALQVAAGYGVEDYLIHSYGIRHLNEDGKHDYDEIIPMGSRYPVETPIDVVLGASHDGQTEIEFVIGEIDTDSISMVEVKYEDGQAVFVAQAGSSEQQIIPLNEKDVLHALAKLDPPAKVGEERIRASFTVDERRRLCVTVTDLMTHKTLLDRVALATLR